MTQNAPDSLNGGDSPNESFTIEQMQQIIRTGEEASQLLGSPVYNRAYQQLLNQKFQAWMTTEPKDRPLREDMYFQAKALVEVTELLASAVEDAQRVIRSQQATNDPSTQEQEYLDQQGFGLNFQ